MTHFMYNVYIEMGKQRTAQECTASQNEPQSFTLHLYANCLV